MGGEMQEETLGIIESSADHENDVIVSKEDLWKDSTEHEVDGAVVQLMGLESEKHTAYARIKEGNSLSVGKVIDVLVDVTWKDVAKAILEKHLHIAPGSHPPTRQLLELGAVWLLNETAYTKSHDAHAHRLSVKDEEMVPDWKDMTLRVHYVPERFFAAHQVDWSKYCRGLLVGNKVEVQIGGEIPHVPVMDGNMPDSTDGVIVYENADLGFAVVDKPGAMPVHATISNHAEDVVSVFGKALKERRKKKHLNNSHVSVPQRYSVSLDTEAEGLLVVATKSQFANYLTHLAEKKPAADSFSRKFKCLVCVKDPDIMDTMEDFQQSGELITHYLDPKSPSPKHFLRHKPKNTKRHDYHVCQLRIIKVGDDKFRAACVRSRYKDSIDSSLAHRLWGPESKTPAEDLKVQYVMELEVELVTNRKHQLRGQLAALGCPIVGDEVYGGGKCEYFWDRHSWNRMALQCSELSFMEPEWANGENGKKELVPSERKCVFRLREAWWTEYLQRYEHYQDTIVAKKYVEE